MKNFFRRTFIAAASFVTLASLLTGCSNNKETVVSLNDKIENKLSEKIKLESMIDLNDFELIGADVVKAGFKYSVNFNGVASIGDENQKAFTTANYVVPSTEFKNYDKYIGTAKIFDVFHEIVDNYDLESYSITPVTSLKDVSDTIIKNSPSPFSDYTLKRGLVYNLSTPVFNDDDLTASFNVMSLVDLRKSSIDVGFGIGFGGRGVGWGFGYVQNIIESTFIISDTYQITADYDKYVEMKENPALVFDYLKELIDTNQEDKIYADRTNVVDVTYDNADMLGDIDFGVMDSTLGND